MFGLSAANRPLTWRQAVAFLAGTTAFFFGMMAFSKSAGLDLVRGPEEIGFWISLSICIAFTIWHLRLVRRHDVYPDILSQIIVRPDAIVQLAQSHLWFDARGCGASVEITGYVQNLTDGDGTLHLRFEPSRLVWNASVTIPELNCDVPPAAVVKVNGKFASHGDTEETHKLYLEGHFYTNGHPIRFKRRRALTKRVHPLLTIGLLFYGHLHAGGGTFVSFATNRADKWSTTTDEWDSDAQSDGQWETTVLWSPEHPELNVATDDHPRADDPHDAFSSH